MGIIFNASFVYHSFSNNPSGDFTIEDLTAFLLYAGFKSIDKFEEFCFIELQYECLYFSQIQTKVFPFLLSITSLTKDVLNIIRQTQGECARANQGKNKIKNKNETPDLFPPIILEGFYRDDVKRVLTGHLEEKYQSWVASLSFGNYFLYLVVHIGWNLEANISSLVDTEWMSGIITGNTASNELYSGEFIMIKKGTNNNYKTQATKYLNLNRRRFLVNGTGFLNNKELLINSNSINKIKRLAAHSYRLMTASQDGWYFQSRFTINEDLTALIEIPVIESTRTMSIKLESYKCFLSFDNITKDRLLVKGYGEQRFLYSTTVIKIPPASSESQELNQILEGAFCITDNERSRDPSGNVFYMIRDDSDFELKIFSASEAKKFRKGSKGKTIGNKTSIVF